MSRVLLAFIRLYRRWFSPISRPSCRYLPSCSEYAQDAIRKYGAWRGSMRAVKRILRCHPFGGSGFDPA